MKLGPPPPSHTDIAKQWQWIITTIPEWPPFVLAPPPPPPLPTPRHSTLPGADNASDQFMRHAPVRRPAPCLGASVLPPPLSPSSCFTPGAFCADGMVNQGDEDTCILLPEWAVRCGPRKTIYMDPAQVGASVCVCVCVCVRVRVCACVCVLGG